MSKETHKNWEEILGKEGLGKLHGYGVLEQLSSRGESMAYKLEEINTDTKKHYLQYEPESMEDMKGVISHYVEDSDPQDVVILTRDSCTADKDAPIETVVVRIDRDEGLTDYYHIPNTMIDDYSRGKIISYAGSLGIEYGGHFTAEDLESL